MNEPDRLRAERAAVVAHHDTLIAAHPRHAEAWAANLRGELEHLDARIAEADATAGKIDDADVTALLALEPEPEAITDGDVAELAGVIERHRATHGTAPTDEELADLGLGELAEVEPGTVEIEWNATGLAVVRLLAARSGTNLRAVNL